MTHVGSFTKLKCDTCEFEELVGFEERTSGELWQHVQVGYGRPGDPQLDFCSKGCATDWFAQRSGHRLVPASDPAS